MTTDPHGPTADLATQGAADLLIRLGSGERTSAAVVSDLLERIAAVDDPTDDKEATEAVRDCSGGSSTSQWPDALAAFRSTGSCFW